jgi:uncharacterized protein (DUF433 family)
MTGGQIEKRGSGDLERVGPPADPQYLVPLYHKAEAARIIRVPASTFWSWTEGTSTLRQATPAKRVSRAQAERDQMIDLHTPMVLHKIDDPLITVSVPSTPRGRSVPFIGLSEAYVLAAFRSAGVPMQRIRPAIRELEKQMGLHQALASERLKTDGAEVLWDYSQVTNDKAERDAVGDLVVIRNGQRVFRSIVADYLRRVTYQDGWARAIDVGAGKVDVTVDPWINGGRPTLTRRGIATADVLSRIRAGEPSAAVAADYGLRAAEITALLELAA